MRRHSKKRSLKSTLSSIIQGPWTAVGDFNVIGSVNEKEGGIPYRNWEKF